MSARVASRSDARRTRLVAVVPVRDGGADVGRSLDGLLGAGLAPRDVRVVDDASRDGAAAAAARARGIPLLAVVDGPRGPAHARNVGARAAVADGADAVLFVDADVVLHADAAERFRAVLDADPGLAAAFGSYDDAPPAPGWVSQYKNLLHHRVHQRGETAACTFWSGCGVVRREPFVAFGGFDESFADASIEDVDLGLRLTDAGRRVRLCPDVLCTHLKRWTLASWLRTDVLKRALPWSRLLARRGRGVPASLNLGHRERASAACALLVAAAAPAAPFVAGAPLALVAALAAFVALQRDLLGFFARRRGLAFAAAATAMHLCYFVYSSVVFVAVRAGAVPRRRASAWSARFAAGSSSRKSNGRR